ncbi:hypothetical protein V7S43_013388 [Phytophthora oleae]|uniref:Uncharacterized protein n=1 Tax=Phytophthora oleae TaxID=2107226 RepID=A0ABD3F7Z3_9STRA
MGWTFREELGAPRDEEDLSRTGFGDAVEIPDDFIAPSRTITRQKPSKSSYIHRKRASGHTSSTSKTHSGDSWSLSDQSSLQHKKRLYKANKPAAEPVDFVYDINMRRKLREQLDAERRNVLLEAKAREAKLRSESKWVFDKRDNSPPRRKQAWQTNCPVKKTVNLSSSESKARVRATSAPSKRSSRSSSSSTCPSDVKMSIREFECRLQSQWNLGI